jgi:hypothetical protein
VVLNQVSVSETYRRRGGGVCVVTDQSAELQRRRSR